MPNNIIYLIQFLSVIGEMAMEMWVRFPPTRCSPLHWTTNGQWWRWAAWWGFGPSLGRYLCDLAYDFCRQFTGRGRWDGRASCCEDLINFCCGSQRFFACCSSAHFQLWTAFDLHARREHPRWVCEEFSGGANSRPKGVEAKWSVAEWSCQRRWKL